MKKKPEITFVFVQVGDNGKRTRYLRRHSFELPLIATLSDSFFIPKGFALREVIFLGARKIQEVTVSGKKSLESPSDDQITARLSQWVSQIIKLEPPVADDLCIDLTTDKESSGGMAITKLPVELPAYDNFRIHLDSERAR